jgi:uncharacterized protein (TIGR02646 family)
MKQINKIEPVFYSNFIRSNKPVEWNDIAQIRPDIRAYMLISEQNCQCAYTEIDIEDDNYSSHIDHFKKQSMFPTLKFDWTNLFTSTNSEYFGAKYKDNKYKIQQAEYQDLINPSVENPNFFFDYDFTGEILVKEKNKNSIEYKRAKLTIEVFNLNEHSLVQQRAKVIKDIAAYFKQLSINDIKQNIGKFDSLVENIYNHLVSMPRQDIENICEKLNPTWLRSPNINK